jgi:hypothetical protein
MRVFLGALIIAAASSACAPTTDTTGSSSGALNSLGEDTPVYFMAPTSGFTSSGSVSLTVWVAKGFYEQSVLDPHGGPKGAGDVTLAGAVAGCGQSYAFNIHSDGSVAPVAVNPHGQATGGYLWTVAVDLSACQCAGGGVVRTHHCDGCGRTFDTCETDTSCTPRDVNFVVDAFNQPTNNMCTLHDFNGDGATDCDVVAGSLSPSAGGGSSELWVPAPFWTDNNTVCVRRAGPDNRCNPVGDPGGHSCDAL